MGTKKYYAVKNGIKPGIYADWETCKAQVEGFPGAIYKSFKTESEAKAFINLDASVLNSQSNTDSPAPAPGTAVAYVDGSFKAGTGKFSYGVVLFVGEQDGSVSETHLSKAFSNPELLEMRNVAGEIMGSGEAMKQARDKGLTRITIYHDYEGIAKWCTGEWKTNKTWTTKYKAFYDEISKSVSVSFVKVKGHSNNRFNDLADELAKSALDQ